MNDVQSTQDMVLLSGDQVMTDSRKVAEHFCKRHKNVLRDIRKMLGQTKGWGRLNFEQCLEINPLANGKPEPYYLMTKDGFMLLVMGFTGEKALQVKLAFIEAFNRMADFIREQASGAWQRWNAAWLEYRHERDHVSRCGRDLGYWRRRKRDHLRRLEQLDPQLCLFAAQH